MTYLDEAVKELVQLSRDITKHIYVGTALNLVDVRDRVLEAADFIVAAKRVALIAEEIKPQPHPAPGTELPQTDPAQD